jgi:hypothetical protein
MLQFCTPRPTSAMAVVFAGCIFQQRYGEGIERGLRHLRPRCSAILQGLTSSGTMAVWFWSRLLFSFESLACHNPGTQFVQS